MRITITGANGFIGSHLTEELSRLGHSVRAVCQPGTDAGIVDGVADEILWADMRNGATLSSLVRGSDAVVHLAARIADYGALDRFQQINIEGTRNLVDASIREHVRRFVYISSLAVHELRNHENGNEETPPDVRKLSYGISKRDAETIVMDADKRGDIESIVIRPGFFPFGPRDRHNFSRLATQMRTGTIPLVNKGRSVLCTAYIDNLVHGIRLAIESENAGGNTYIIGDGTKITWKSLLSKIASLVGAKPPRLSFPYPIALCAGAFWENVSQWMNPEKEPLITAYRSKIAARNLYFSIDKARVELGYEPPVSLQQGLEKTAEWFLSVAG